MEGVGVGVVVYVVGEGVVTVGFCPMQPENAMSETVIRIAYIIFSIEVIQPSFSSAVMFYENFLLEPHDAVLHP